MVPMLWGDTNETRILAKKNLEKNLERILMERDEVNINEIYKELWHVHHLLSHFLQIYLLVKELENEGKIIIDENNNIKRTKISYFNLDEITEIHVWDIHHQREETKKKKEIMKKYQIINYLL
jgi:hypothetical protein